MKTLIVIGMLSFIAACGAKDGFENSNVQRTSDVGYKMFKDVFRQSSQPTKEKMRLGKVWTCEDFHYFHGAGFPGTRQFRLFGGVYHDDSQTHYNVKSFQFSSTSGLVGTAQHEKHRFRSTVKVTRDDKLIIENIHDINLYNAFAFSYTVCVPE